MFDSPIRPVQPVSAIRAFREVTLRRRPSRAQLWWARWFAKDRGSRFAKPVADAAADRPSSRRHEDGQHAVDIDA
jgi:hypothetical protein